MTYKIEKAKVTKGYTLVVSIREFLDDKTERLHPGVECDQLTHADLRAAFDKLKPHLVCICDLRESDGLDLESFDPENDLKAFKVTSFAIGGHDDSEGVTLFGQKELGSKILNLPAPFTKYNDELEPYIHASELAEAIQLCVYEVEQYLFNGKYAIKQLEIPFEGEDPDQVFGENANQVGPTVLGQLGDSILEHEKKKSKRGKTRKMIESVESDLPEGVTEVEFEEAS